MIIVTSYFYMILVGSIALASTRNTIFVLIFGSLHLYAVPALLSNILKHFPVPTGVTLKVCEIFQSIDHICRLSISGPPSPCWKKNPVPKVPYQYKSIIAFWCSKTLFCNKPRSVENGETRYLSFNLLISHGERHNHFRASILVTLRWVILSING